MPAAVASAASGTALDEMEGGKEAYESYLVADILAKPAANAVDAGRERLGYTGGGGSPGEAISPEQYQAVVDDISDENGKEVVAFALPVFHMAA